MNEQVRKNALSQDEIIESMTENNTTAEQTEASTQPEGLRRPPRRTVSPETKAAAAQISDQLGETEWGPRKLIEAVVDLCGLEFAQQLLEESLRVEAEGGMMVVNEERKRTIGGIFFYLARGRMPVETRKIIFPPHNLKPKKKKKPGMSSLKWAERAAVLKPLLEEKGVATTVKIVLIGRPGRVEMRKDLTITTMSHVNKPTTLPKGVPMPPSTPTVYTVYIGAKQWNKVAEAINDPADALIIEGTCAFDKEIGAVAVFASSVTTKALEKAAAVGETPDAGAESAEAVEAPAASKPARAPKPAAASPAPKHVPVAVNVPIPANAPPEVAQKLRELHTAAEVYRQKIATIESKPGNQQFGLEMTQKLLKNVEERWKRSTPSPKFSLSVMLVYEPMSPWCGFSLFMAH
jgi:PHAX RNA-binding domain